MPQTTYFGPSERPVDVEPPVVLSFVELEAIRLCDLDGLTQEEAASQMGISRRTFWNELKAARAKVVRALVEGRPIRIEGGDFAVRSGKER